MAQYSFWFRFPNPGVCLNDITTNVIPQRELSDRHVLDTYWIWDWPVKKFAFGLGRRHFARRPELSRIFGPIALAGRGFVVVYTLL